ncbi:uncharacterized protein LOC116933635 [Daphnia magna]|uniref:uncharacterized protein LOC116933635 n=1 Tax=Daphnia magna TaxID=35525 RepID=UPI0014034C30|nr:uncharacterized protein LOC116933635 [Daphnia magna]
MEENRRKRKQNNKEASTTDESISIPKKQKYKKGAFPVSLELLPATEDNDIMIKSMIDWTKNHSYFVQHSRKIYEYIETTFICRQKQSITTFKSASYIMKEYPRFVDVDDGALIIKDFRAKSPHITEATFKTRFLERFSSSLLILARRNGEEIPNCSDV